RAHSYEEPAFDIYPLRAGLSSQGEGRIGRLPQATTMAEFAQAVKNSLRAAALGLVGEPARMVERIAIVCGAGGEFLPDAIHAKAAAFLTGELRFPDYLAARAGGLGLVLPGHYATERFGVEELADRLQKQFPELEVWASRRERDPLQWV